MYGYNSYYELDDCQPRIRRYFDGDEVVVECDCDDCEHKEECEQWT